MFMELRILCALLQRLSIEGQLLRCRRRGAASMHTISSNILLTSTSSIGSSSSGASGWSN